MNIYEKILAVMNDVEYLKKDGNVSFKAVNYNYLSEEKITASVRGAMIEHRLIMYPAGCEQVQCNSNFDEIIMTYRIVDIDIPESFIDIKTKGCGQDSGDKKSYKAMTGAFKYAMRQTFMISTGDDPDRNSSDKTKSDIDKKKKSDDDTFYEKCKSLAKADRDKYDGNLFEFSDGKITSAKDIPVNDRDKFLKKFEAKDDSGLPF